MHLLFYSLFNCVFCGFWGVALAGFLLPPGTPSGRENLTPITANHKHAWLGIPTTANHGHTWLGPRTTLPQRQKHICGCVGLSLVSAFVWCLVESCGEASPMFSKYFQDVFKAIFLLIFHGYGRLLETIKKFQDVYQINKERNYVALLFWRCF